MDLGERLLEYRKAKKLSQEDVAEKIGVSRQTVSKWETNQSMPDFDKIVPLCELFEIDANELLTGNNNRNGEKENNNVSEVKKSTNKRKGIIISISVFLYIIGTFALPYMIEVLEYQDEHALMVTAVLWGIATAILIYYFVSHPSKKEEKDSEIKENGEDAVNKEKENTIENQIVEIIALIFTVIYLAISFITMAWHITWIIWIIFAIVEAIVKLEFSLKENKKYEKKQ